MADTPTIEEIRAWVAEQPYRYHLRHHKDAKYIDFLLAEVDRLKAENERLEQQRQPIRIAGVEIPDPHPGYDCCGTCPLHLGLPYTAQD